MISQEFTLEGLNRLRRRGGQFKYLTDDGSFPRDAGEWRSFLTRLQDEILGSSFRFRPLDRRIMRSGKPMFSTASLENVMVMRKINDNIRRAYRVKQANRFDTIRQVQQALSENTPKYVMRLDIRSFYESVPKRALLEKIRSDRLVSTRTLELLNRLLRLTGHMGATGLPRGLQISATLAELHAAQLERDLRAISGVYYVARYVDDVVVFSTFDSSYIHPQVKAAFERHSLRINQTKSQSVYVGCRCQPMCSTHAQVCPCAKRCKCAIDLSSDKVRHIDLLGYRIAFPDVNSGKSANEIRTYLATKKVKKIESRIHAAVASYRQSGDALLLRDRVLFLTGNYQLESLREGGKLFGGIYFNFDLYRPFADDLLLIENRFEHLDRVLRKALLSTYASDVSLSRTERRRILSMTFSNGHLRRRLRKLTPQRIGEIGRGWYAT